MVLLNVGGIQVASAASIQIAGTSAQHLTTQQLTGAAQLAFGRRVWLLHDGGAAMGRRDFPARFEVLDVELLERRSPVSPLPHARPWQRPGWRREALAWMKAQIGGPVNGLAWVHTSDVGAVLTAQTGSGRVYLKAGEDGREARAAVQIAAQIPDLTPDILAADPERGWLLTRDAGSCLLESPELSHWPEAVWKLVRVQTEVQLKGLPVHPFAALPQQARALLAPEVLAHWGLTGEQQAQVRGLLPRLLTVHAQVSVLELPECACHGDFHPNNALVKGNRVRLFDGSEACTAHPFSDIGWFLAFVMHPMRNSLKLRQEHLNLGKTLWQLYLQASGTQTDLTWQDAALLALFHRAVVYDAKYRHWTGTLMGFVPQVTPYSLKMARRFGASGDPA